MESIPEDQRCGQMTYEVITSPGLGEGFGEIEYRKEVAIWI